MAKSLTQQETNMLMKIPNRGHGNPMDIHYTTESTLDIDYLQCVKELSFLEDTLKHLRAIVEIGGGYGRSAHGILSVFPNIERYYIVDLMPVLRVAEKYLWCVLTEALFNKIVFIEACNFRSRLEESPIDLCININSFQEMPIDTIRTYFTFIDNKCSMFYTNNTIGKFSPDLCGMPLNNPAKLALDVGILREQIDVFSQEERKLAQEKFLKVFTPSGQWACVQHEECVPWPHFYQALYKKSS